MFIAISTVISGKSETGSMNEESVWITTVSLFSYKSVETVDIVRITLFNPIPNLKGRDLNNQNVCLGTETVLH